MTPGESLRRSAGVVLLVALLSGCATRAPAPGRDGPDANPPPDLMQVPDAVPRIEAIRPGGPNKPYEVLGQRYTPMPADAPLSERGLASWYGRKFHGRPTASGEAYDMYAMTAAHRTLPLPSYLRVRNPANGREVIVRVNDRGPFVAGRIVDLSYTAALKLDLLRGVAPVQIERITNDEIRNATWMAVARDDSGTVAQPTLPVAQVVNENAPEPTAVARGFWVQLGAFRERDGAQRLHRQAGDALDWLAPLLAVFNDRSLHRVQAGPYASRDEAAGVAERIRAALLLVPVVIERR